MYAIVLAATMTAGTAAADLHHRGGCHGCYGGCSGNAFSACYGCCGGISWGCHGCYGCYGASCYGCYGSSCFGCCGCYGAACFGGCGGCWGSSLYGAALGGYGAAWGGGVWYEAYGGFGGCGGCFGGCFGGCTGYYGAAFPSYFPGHAKGPGYVPPANGGKLEIGTGAPATVVVKAPLAATVKANGEVTTRRAAEESFQTPALVAGKAFAYNFEATLKKDGKTLTASRRVTVQAGGRAVVDFSDLGAEEAPAKVTVLLPEGAKLTVNGVVYGSGARQSFDTPKLAKGKRYFYTVEAERKQGGRAVTEKRRITVEAGKAVTVDFTASKEEVLTASR